MLYLEDYLEMIEHLPQELRDRFTEIREMDLSVQNNMDTLDKQLRVLFAACRRGELAGDAAAARFAEVRRGYTRTGEEADEKVQLATQMYELVLRYIRRLDSELHKFKCELEADNKGVTELLEKRSLELDAPVPSPVTAAHSASAAPASHHYRDSRYRVRAEKRRDSWGAPRESRSHGAAAPLSRTDSAIQAALGRESGYSLGHAGSAIAAAASQAIAATQQMQQGRRTASLKASYEAVAGGVGGSELAGAAHHAVHATQHLGHGGAAASGGAAAGAAPVHAHSSASSSSSSNKRHKKAAAATRARRSAFTPRRSPPAAPPRPPSSWGCRARGQARGRGAAAHSSRRRRSRTASGRTTPTSRATVSATRSPTGTWSPATTRIVRTSGSTTRAWASPRHPRASGTVRSVAPTCGATAAARTSRPLAPLCPL